MSLGGWIFLILAWGTILGLTIFCFFKTLTLNLREEKRTKSQTKSH